VIDSVREALGTTPIRTFAEPIPSAAAAAEQLGCPVGAIANSLVFVVNGAPLLVLTSGAHRVDLRRVADHLGVSKNRVRRASPEFVLQVTGQVVGGVAPVGHPAPITTLVDTSLEQYDEVWTGAGDRHSVYPTTFADLLRLTGGTAVDVGEG
jgi:prolyl-tRNA editing enzyme YbaK/EbsC (Cys-tRNA(Pro) deacylase)